MKVMVLTRGYPTERYPGNGIFEFNQAKALQKQGLNVVFAAVDIRSLRRWRKWGFERKIIEGVKVYAINIPIGRMPGLIKRAAGIIGAKILYKKVLKYEGKPSIIHAHFTFEGYLAGVLKKKFAIPVVLTEHSSKILAVPINKDTDFLAKKAYKNVDCLIAVSSALQKLIFEKFSVRAIVIPNMFDDEYFYYKPKPFDLQKNEIQVVSAGNLLKSKRHDVSIRALASVVEKYPQVKLTIFGEGPERVRLNELINQLGVNNRVKLPGHVTKTELSKAFQNADFFVLPSAYETFGLVYVEAMACGLPVIATRCLGPECFVNETNGIFVDVDNQEQLNEAFLTMVENYSKFNKPLIAEEMKRNFSPEAVVDQIIRIYEKVIYTDRGVLC